MRYCLLVIAFCFSVVSAEPIKITDSRGKLTFDQPPKNVVVINWTLTEQLLELGITPIAVADIEGYHQQGGKPRIPDGVIDLGKRSSPDFTKIKALKPDIILVGYSQKPLLHVLENLGTVVYFRHFSHRYNNEAQSRKVFLKLAALFDKTEMAEKKLQQRDQAIAKLKQALLEKYSQGLPRVTIVLPERRYVWVFAENSMPRFAQNQLGLASSISYEASKFGVKKVSIADLPASKDCVLYLTDHDDKGTQNDVAKGLSQLVSAFSCVKRLPAVNAYGGAMSVQYLAEAITQALLAD